MSRQLKAKHPAVAFGVLSSQRGRPELYILQGNRRDMSQGQVRGARITFLFHRSLLPVVSGKERRDSHVCSAH